MLLACGPTPSIDRLNGLTRNIAENEPIFLGLAVAMAIGSGSSAPPAWGAAAVAAFCTVRVAHAVFYLTAAPQPARALAWLSGAGLTLALAAKVLFFTRRK